MDWTQWVVALLLGIVITVLLTILLTDPMYYFLTWLLGGIIPRRPRSVRGIWRSTYNYESHGNMHTATQIMVLRQVGTYVIGKNLAGVVHRHKLQGRVRDQLYVTGTWENILRGRLYHGAFQFVLHPDGQQMIGEWLGFNSQNRIAHGPWHWELLEPSVGKQSRLQVLSRLALESKTATSASHISPAPNPTQNRSEGSG